MWFWISHILKITYKVSKKKRKCNGMQISSTFWSLIFNKMFQKEKYFEEKNTTFKSKNSYTLILRVQNMTDRRGLDCEISQITLHSFQLLLFFSFLDRRPSNFCPLRFVVCPSVFSFRMFVSLHLLLSAFPLTSASCD